MANDLAPGLYEELVSAALVERLVSVDDALVEQLPLRAADAADRIAQHLARELLHAIDAVPEAERVATGIDVARRLIGEKRCVYRGRVRRRRRPQTPFASWQLSVNGSRTAPYACLVGR